MGASTCTDVPPGTAAAEGPIGLVGLGLVGHALAARLLAAGHRVVGRDLDPVAEARARGLGVETARTPAEVGERCRTVLLSLPASPAVETALWSEAGLGPAIASGGLVIDTTTADPAETVRHGRRLAERGVRLVDCALVGSSAEIAAGRATALVGDTGPAGYAPLLASVAARLFFLGGVGRGHTAKLVVNLVLGLHRLVLAEGLGLAHRSGLDPAQMLDVLRNSAARSEVMATKGGRMLARDFADPAARLAQHAKDVGLILDLAAATGARTPLSALHAALLEEAVAAGWGPLDNAAVLNLFLPLEDESRY